MDSFANEATSLMNETTSLTNEGTSLMNKMYFFTKETTSFIIEAVI